MTNAEKVAEELRILRAAADGRLTISPSSRYVITGEPRPDRRCRERLQRADWLARYVVSPSVGIEITAKGGRVLALLDASTRAERGMSGPSEPAMTAASKAMQDEFDRFERLGRPYHAPKVLRAAHDPALGLDRSVCLRDVITFLERGQDRYGGWDRTMARAVSEQFGGCGQ